MNDKNRFHSICIYLCWFGGLPSYYWAWRKSALANQSIDFYIFTDRTEIISESNIIVNYFSFDQLRELFQSKYDFIITLDKPYKLCDYKPALGDIFYDITKQYDFWAYCDMDMVFGDIRAFINGELLNNVFRIFTVGYFSVYRTSRIMIDLYKNDGNYPEYNYREAFSTGEACLFDEFRGMEPKCYRNNISIYYAPVARNYDHRKHGFYNKSGEQVYLQWDHGKLFEINYATLNKTEILFAHYCKRKMDSDKMLQDTFYISSTAITNKKPKFIDYPDIHEKKYMVNFYINRLHKRINEDGIVRFISLQIRRKRISKYNAYLRRKIKRNEKL